MIIVNSLVEDISKLLFLEFVLLTLPMIVAIDSVCY